MKITNRDIVLLRAFVIGFVGGLFTVALMLLVNGCVVGTDMDASNCSTPDAGSDAAGAMVCGDPGESCCIADIDGVAMLYCHSGLTCLYLPEGHSDPQYQGTCPRPEAE